MAVNRNMLNGAFINIQSVGNKTNDIRELINQEQLDFFALAETWLGKHDCAKIQEMTPDTHLFLHSPRLNKRGGGVGIFVSNSFSRIQIDKCTIYDTFESMQVSCVLEGRRFIFIVVYRPPNGNAGGFLMDFRSYLETVDLVSFNVFILGDFNFWVEDARNSQAAQFMEMMYGFDFVNKVEKVTSIAGHMLDLVFCNAKLDLLQEVSVDDLCSISPVHRLIRFHVACNRVNTQVKMISFRAKKRFNPIRFIEKVTAKLNTDKYSACCHGREFLYEKFNCVDCMCELYNCITREEYDKMCPVIEKSKVIKDHAPWFNSDIIRAKRTKKKYEKLWRKLRTDASRNDYKKARNEERKVIIKRKRQYYSSKVEEAKSDIRKLYSVLNGLTGSRTKPKLPEGYSNDVLANKFLGFFEDKIKQVVEGFSVNGCIFAWVHLE